jgi:hypothetical protein
MMSRGRGAVLITIVLLLLAGCAGGGGEPTLETVDYPEGYNESGITNTTSAVVAHKLALDEPYRVSFQLNQVGDRGAVETDGTIRAIPDEKRARISVKQTLGGQTKSQNKYRTANRTYWQSVMAGDFRYGSTEQTFNTPIYADQEDFLSMFGSVKLNATEVQTTNQTTLIRYRVENVTPTRMHTTIKNASGSVTVATDGQIRSMDVTFEQYITGIYRDVQYGYSSTETNVTVERPSWTDKAR